jgi:hypothetical protein
VRLKAEAAGRGDNVDARVEATTQAGRVARRAVRGGGEAPEAGEDDAEEEDGEEEPRRPGKVVEEAGRVPGADGGGPRDGNKEFPVGDRPPIPVPAGTNVPRPRPRRGLHPQRGPRPR